MGGLMHRGGSGSGNGPLFDPLGQGTLFENPVVHADDPPTSELAASEMERSGRRRIHAERVFQAIARLPDATAPELALEAGLEEYQVRRRVTDLFQAGRIVRSGMRPCTVKQTMHLTWRRRI